MSAVTWLDLVTVLNPEPSDGGYFRLDWTDGRLIVQPVRPSDRPQTVATYGPLFRDHRCPTPVGTPG